MNKFLITSIISILLNINGFSQAIDSILIQSNIKIYMFENSEISYNLDSTICSYFSNDTIEVYINYAFSNIDTTYVTPNYLEPAEPTDQDTIFNNCNIISSFINDLIRNPLIASFDTVLFSHIDSAIFNYFSNDSSMITTEQFEILDTTASSTLTYYIINDTTAADSVIYLYQYLGFKGNFMLTILGKTNIINDQPLLNKLQTLFARFEEQWGFEFP